MSFRLTPSVLLSILQPWTGVAEPIYRRVAQMCDAADKGETLWIGSGSGRSVIWWSQKFTSMIEGVDPDPNAIESAEERIRGTDLVKNATFQVANPSNLPHEDHVFDTVVVHTLFLRGLDMQEVIHEAVRVLRPKGNVVVIAPSWLQTPRETDAKLIESLGFAPRVTMEWKGFLRDAGAVELTVDEAAREGGWLEPGLLSLFVRGWRAAGWTGARSMLSREIWTLRRVARNRVLGLSILKGVRWPHS